MPRRRHRALPLRAAALAAVALGCPAAPAQDPIDNVVLITVDTLRADHVGAYGGVVLTPALDALARQGVVVEGACTPTPSTGPAHVSLLSGLHPWRHGVLDTGVPFDGTRLPSLASRARDAGLRTAAFVSSYVLHPRWGFARGFELYRFEPVRSGMWEEGGVAFSTPGEETRAPPCAGCGSSVTNASWHGSTSSIRTDPTGRRRRTWIWCPARSSYPTPSARRGAIARKGSCSEGGPIAARWPRSTRRSGGSSTSWRPWGFWSVRP